MSRPRRAAQFFYLSSRYFEIGADFRVGQCMWIICSFRHERAEHWMDCPIKACSSSHNPYCYSRSMESSIYDSTSCCQIMADDGSPCHISHVESFGWLEQYQTIRACQHTAKIINRQQWKLLGIRIARSGHWEFISFPTSCLLLRYPYYSLSLKACTSYMLLLLRVRLLFPSISLYTVRCVYCNMCVHVLEKMW